MFDRPLRAAGVLAATVFLFLFAAIGLAPSGAQAQTPATTVENGAGDVRFQLNYDGGFYIPGLFGTQAPADSIPASGPGTRMMWYPAKAAFRAGRVGALLDGTQWDASKVGQHSVAFGLDTKASGFVATAIGNRTVASGGNAFAMGLESTAGGASAAALGFDVTASGNQSVAMGFRTTAATPQSVTIGEHNSANQSNDGSLLVVGNGSGTDSRSDALVLDETGNLEVSGGFVLPDGTKLDESSDVGGLPKNANGASSVANDDGFLATGTFNSGGSIPAEGSGTRMMFYPDKGAFRAGRVGRFKDGTQWNSLNIGDYSVAFGLDTEADGDNAMAVGLQTLASGGGAVAMGRATDATGGNAFAMGGETTASGRASMAMGSETVASASAATAIGNNTTASGPNSTAMGSQSVASGDESVATGIRTTASGKFSVALGYEATASGDQALATGFNTVAATEESFTTGIYNSANQSADGSLFVVGNGTTASTRSDALVLDVDGNLTISGSLTESSDRRLKTNIEPLSEGVLERLGGLEPVRYRFNDRKTRPEGEHIGLLAQDVRKEFPSLVSKGADGYLSLSYSKLTAALVKGIQEQQTKLKRQEERIRSLERKTSKLGRLEKRLAALEASQSPSAAASLIGTGVQVALAFLLGGLVGAGLLWRRRG